MWRRPSWTLQLKIGDIDYRSAQVYLASTLNESEVKSRGLKHLLPRRLHKRGHKPGPTTDELRMKHRNPRKTNDNEQQQKTKWDNNNPPELMTDKDRRRLLAATVALGVEVVFSHHIYKFRGICYKQLEGGPIGLRLTSLVARLVMDAWARQFLRKLDMAGVKLWAFIKYVDDINIVLNMVSLDTHWEGDKLVTRPQVEKQDERPALTREEHTMSLVIEAANSVYPWLSFTADIPSNNGSLTVPMLDIQVWVEHSSSSTSSQPSSLTPSQQDSADQGSTAKNSAGPDRLCWSFYEKPAMTARVLRATSGYGWRSKIVTMMQETLRRMRNTCRQVSTATRSKILKEFACKLRVSGYSSLTTVNMIKSGLRFYYRKLRIELEGGPLLNNRNSNEDVQTRRMKLGASLRWFTET